MSDVTGIIWPGQDGYCLVFADPVTNSDKISFSRSFIVPSTASDDEDYKAINIGNEIIQSETAI